MTKRCGVALVLFVLCGLAPTPAASQAADGCPDSARYVGKLVAGRPLFWLGGYADAATADGMCTYDYALDVGAGGRLRVAVDLVLDYRRDEVHASALCRQPVHCDADNGRGLRFEVLDEAGAVVRSVADGPVDYSTEVFLCFRPSNEMCEAGVQDYSVALDRSSQGRWTVRVVPDEIGGWAFRLRAELSGPAPASDASLKSKPEPPNLRSVPPFELTFCEPFFQRHGAAGVADLGPICDESSNGLTSGEEAELTAEQGPAPRRGLRFSAGPENAGSGSFDVGVCEGREPGEDADGNRAADACQRVWAPDGSWVEREAGARALLFHRSHGHWHYQFFRYELLEVTASGVVSVTEGRKVGFCPGDERLAEWGRLFQQSRYRWSSTQSTGHGCLSETNPRMGISVGWGDLYEYQRPDQFVEFPIAHDGSPVEGRYVLRATVDAYDGVLETHEGDNESYASFEVCGCAGAVQGIRLVERGYGGGPWDPDKRVEP